MNKADLKRFARAGAELEYVTSLRRQALLKRLFPGIDKSAMVKMRRDLAAHARDQKARRRA